MHPLSSPIKDSSSPRHSYRTNHGIRPQPSINTYRSDPPLYSGIIPNPERHHFQDRNRINPSQPRASGSSLRYSESPQRLASRINELGQNRNEPNEGYTSPELLEKLREKINPQNDVQHAHESLHEQRQWVRRPPFSAIRLWCPMYQDAENLLEFYQRNAAQDIQLYGRTDYVQPFYIPSDELVISDADQLTTECQTKSQVQIIPNITIVEKEEEQEEEDLRIRHADPPQKQMMSRISEKPESMQDSERGSLISQFRKAISQPLNPIYVHKPALHALTIRAVQCGLELEKSKAEGQAKFNLNPINEEPYERLLSNHSQNTLTQIKNENCHSNIEKMTYEELSTSIVRMLKTMDDAIKSQTFDQFSQRINKPPISEIKPEPENPDLMKKNRLFESNLYEIQRPKQSKIQNQLTNRSEQKFSAKSISKKSFKQDENDSSFKALKRLSERQGGSKRSKKFEEAKEKFQIKLLRTDSYKSYTSQEEKVLIKKSLLENSEKLNVGNFIEQEKESVEMEMERKPSQAFLSENNEGRDNESRIIKVEEEPEVEKKYESIHSSQEKSSEPELSEREKLSRFMKLNSQDQDCSFIFPIEKRQSPNVLKLVNQSRMLQSNDQDSPFTCSEKKSMMRVFNEQFDSSTTNIFNQVNQINDIREVQSNEIFDKSKKNSKMVNFAKNNLFETSKSVPQPDKINENYNTVPYRCERQSFNDFEDPKGVPEFPRLNILMRDNQMKESVMGSEDMSSNQGQMNNPSDSEGSRKESVREEEQENERF